MYFSTQELEARGWTKTLIKKYLAKPDHIKRLGYYCYQHFYLESCVAGFESSDEWKSSALAASKRRESAIKATDKRRKEYLDYLENKMPVRVRLLDEVDLIERACCSYNRRQIRRAESWDFSDNECEFWQADLQSDPEFLQRITVNYIRHNLTSYDNLLESTFGKLAKAEAIEIIQRRVFVAIADTYPQYKEECKRQCERKGISLPKFFNYQISEQMSLF